MAFFKGFISLKEVVLHSEPSPHYLDAWDLRLGTIFA